ncbi:FAS1 domain-containing protein [Paraphysoderma sedebokerense]|nr:FAS1 domain-containing protein [Paraphysoderma sedebokerense]
MKPNTLPLVLSFLSALVGVALSQQPPTAWAFLSQNPQYSKFQEHAANTSTILVSYLDNPSAKLTLFAPTNDAYSTIDPKILDPASSGGSSTVLSNLLLQYHVVANESFMYAGTLDRDQNTTLTSALGADINLRVGRYNDFTPYVNDANVTNPDQMVGNGVVHGIGKVLQPFSLLGIDVIGNITNPPALSIPPILSQTPSIQLPTALPTVSLSIPTALPTISIPTTLPSVSLPTSLPSVSIPTAITIQIPTQAPQPTAAPGLRRRLARR